MNQSENQQWDSTSSHLESWSLQLLSVFQFCGDLHGKEIQKRGDICIYSADTLFCKQKLPQHWKATILQSKLIKKKKKIPVLPSSLDWQMVLFKSLPWMAILQLPTTQFACFPYYASTPPLPTRTFFPSGLYNLSFSQKFFFLTSPLLKFCSVTNSSRKETEFSFSPHPSPPFSLLPWMKTLLLLKGF